MSNLGDDGQMFPGPDVTLLGGQSSVLPDFKKNNWTKLCRSGSNLVLIPFDPLNEDQTI